MNKQEQKTNQAGINIREALDRYVASYGKEMMVSGEFLKHVLGYTDDEARLITEGWKQ